MFIERMVSPELLADVSAEKKKEVYFNSKENCRWATRKQQSNNTRTVRLITFNGKTLSLSDWAKEIGIDVTTLSRRLDKMGLSFEDAISWKKNQKSRKV